MQVQLGVGEWRRSVANDVDVPLVNRYFERDPTNQRDQGG